MADVNHTPSSRVRATKFTVDDGITSQGGEKGLLTVSKALLLLQHVDWSLEFIPGEFTEGKLLSLL